MTNMRYDPITHELSLLKCCNVNICATSYLWQIDIRCGCTDQDVLR